MKARGVFGKHQLVTTKGRDVTTTLRINKQGSKFIVSFHKCYTAL